MVLFTVKLVKWVGNKGGGIEVFMTFPWFLFGGKKKAKVETGRQEVTSMKLLLIVGGMEC